MAKKIRRKFLVKGDTWHSRRSLWPPQSSSRPVSSKFDELRVSQPR
jgi:CYTH domain-containing protein